MGTGPRGGLGSRIWQRWSDNGSGQSCTACVVAKTLRKTPKPNRQGPTPNGPSGGPLDVDRPLRSQLVATFQRPTQREFEELNRIADDAAGLSDDELLLRLEAVVDDQAAAIIQDQVRRGVQPSVAIAPFREVGIEFQRLERFAFRAPELGAVGDANFAQDNIVKPGKRYSPVGRDLFSRAAGTPIATVADLVKALEEGAITARQVPVDFVVVEGHQLILNTRTSTALRQAGVPQSEWYGRNQTGKVAYTRDPDDAVPICTGDPGHPEVLYDDLARSQLENNGLPPEGSPVLGVDR